MTYRSTKTFGHNLGLSCCFRQWRAESHCRFLHGYSLEIRVEFESDELDIRHWVVDFGSLKNFRDMLERTFDHKLLVAEDDLQLQQLLGSAGAATLCQVADVVIVKATGCEAFAELIYEYGEIWLKDNGYAPRVRMHSVEVREHGANSAIFYRPEQTPAIF